MVVRNAIACSVGRALRMVVRIVTRAESALAVGVVMYVPRTGGDEPDMAIDPRPRVPARVRLLRIVHAHRNDVATAIAEVWGKVVTERAVPVGSLPEVLPVDPHLAVAIDAVEFDEDQLAGIGRRNGERLAIPPHAARQRAAPHARGILFAEFSLDAPVVRHIERAPAGIGER